MQYYVMRVRTSVTYGFSMKNIQFIYSASCTRVEEMRSTPHHFINFFFTSDIFNIIYITCTLVAARGKI